MITFTSQADARRTSKLERNVAGLESASACGQPGTGSIRGKPSSAAGAYRLPKNGQKPPNVG